jgi:hypothetical protein
MKNAEVHTAPYKPRISERLTWNHTNGGIGWRQCSSEDRKAHFVAHMLCIIM